MLHHWRGETFPILADLITSTKASKFMCDPVVVPFQVSNLPAAKQPARLKIPWARWPISSLFSFATILWTTGRESVSVITCWSSSPLLAKSQLNPFRGSFPAYFTSGWFMEEIVGGLFIVLKQVWCKVPILGWSLALGFMHPLISAMPNWPCCHYHNFQILPSARMCSETSEKPWASWLLSLIATGHSFHLSHTSSANLHLKIAWGMDSNSDSHKGQALSVLIPQRDLI